RRLAVAHRVHGQAFTLEVVGHELHDVGVVLDDQGPAGHGQGYFERLRPLRMYTPDMRVVVTGGTGFIGREIVANLLARGGADVAVTTRDPSRDDPWAGRVERVQAFAGDLLSLGRAFT